MKRGKSVSLKLYPNIKTTYGTVDAKDFKSLYINIQSWVIPKYEIESWVTIINTFNRQIKHSVYNSINTQIFSENSIVDLDLRSSGILMGKKSFLNLEVNLYCNSPIDFKSNEIKDSVKSIIHTIYKDNFHNSKYFDFSISKKSEHKDLNLLEC